MSERLTLPVLPLRDVVLFPGVTTSIGAGRPGTVRAIEAALATPDHLVFAVCQRENTEAVSALLVQNTGGASFQQFGLNRAKPIALVYL